MDSRVADLIHTLKAEGLSGADREAAHNFASAAAAGNYADLLRGKLAEAGGVLGSVAAHKHRGLSAGRVLLAGLLCSNGQCARYPEALLTEQEVTAFTLRLNRADITCARLLDLLGRVKNEIRLRQTAAALASHLTKTNS